MKPAVRAGAFGLALATSLVVAFLVFRGSNSPWLAIPWLLSLFPFALATRDRPRETRPTFRPSTAAFLLIAAALPVLVRIVNFDSNRMHTDEFMTGYFSATHDFAHLSFFGSIPEYWEWQGQFPTPFFFLQRVFFTLFGESMLTVRLSVQIYVAIVSLMLFLIVREILDQKAALVAVVLYSFFAASIYLETLGLMFISSTAIFTVFFYFALREYRTEETFHAALAGMACGLCYLTYYTSYLAFPLFVVVFAVQLLRRRNIAVLQNFAIALAGMLLVLAPFMAFGLRYGNYVAARTNQLGLLTGDWSPHREAIAAGTNPIPIVRDNLILSLKSFFQDGIGGGGGYDFGHQAFFGWFSLVLFLTGILAGLVLLFRRSELLFVFLVIAAAFFGFVVLVLPPPGYHRLSIAFPFMVILMTLPFSLLLRIRQLPVSIRYALAGGLLLVFACVNQRYFTEAVIHDQPSDDLRLSALLNQRFDGRTVYVAAFDAFSFQKIFYFQDRWRKSRHVETGFHDNLLKKFNPNETYVYVIILPEPFRKRFEQADPHGRWARFSDRYSLFWN